MKVLLVHVDGKFPNLALMKLSSYHKSERDQVLLLRLREVFWKGFTKGFLKSDVKPETLKVDKAYISCVYEKNRTRAFEVKNMLESMDVDVEVGGVGVDLKAKLPDDVEFVMPDYDLYKTDYSLGYTTRGCFRSCPWCVVWKAEGNIREHQNLEDFLHPRHRKIMLLDNNILGDPSYEDTFIKLIKHGLKVCFTQGLDIRLADSNVAKLLTHIDSRDSKFERPRVYFSFDVPEMADKVEKGIHTLVKHGISPEHLFFYMLVGFNVKKEDYTWEYFLENDYRRFEILRKYKCRPFIMVYNNRKDIPLLIHFRRYVYLEYYHSMDFKKYLKHRSPKLFRRMVKE